MEEGVIKTIGKYSYFTQKCLGEGSFGKVFEGYENTTKEKIAVKKVDFKTIQKDPYLEKAIHQQIKILSKFKHPNIVQLIEVLNSKRSLYIIMEYCKDGDLKKYLKKREKEGLLQQEVILTMRQIVKGYQQLAKNNTIHRDLKPANILINNGLFKICDFGFSKVIKDPSMANKTCVGSPIYMAPQILDKKDYSAKCDIWSLGIIFYEMLHGTVPWTAKSERELLTKIKTDSFPCPKATPATQKIIRQMLQVSEEKRATLRDLQTFFSLNNQRPNTSPLSPLSSLSNQPSIMTSPNTTQVAAWQEKTAGLEPTVQAKVINRNYFQELSWRYFVCVQIRTNLMFLNHFNLKQNFFERYIVLLIASILSSLKKKKAEIDRIHQKQAIARIRKDFQIYTQFQKDFHQFLNDSYVTCQILKQFDLTDIASGNYTEEVCRRAEADLLKNSHVILRQLQEEVKLNQSEEEERLILMHIAELILDMILLNQRQTKTGAGEIDSFLIDRARKPIQKRVADKLSSLKESKKTEFF